MLGACGRVSDLAETHGVSGRETPLDTLRPVGDLWPWTAKVECGRCGILKGSRCHRGVRNEAAEIRELIDNCRGLEL